MDEIDGTGGDVAMADDRFLAGIREVVYQRSTPLATQYLRITESRLGDQAGVVGAAAMVLDHILSPAAVDEMITVDRLTTPLAANAR